MKKKDLIRLIDRAMETEEKAVEIFSKSVSSTLQWMDCSEADRRKIEESLLQLGSDSSDHYKKLTELREAVINNPREDF